MKEPEREPKPFVESSKPLGEYRVGELRLGVSKLYLHKMVAYILQFLFLSVMWLHHPRFSSFVFSTCTAQYGSHKSQKTVEHLSHGWLHLPVSKQNMGLQRHSQEKVV